ncbi:endoplasmic reticulum-Golgi intermediate compartment protein 1-like [Branchiostoma floridae x Branchiostoma japonicum]
MPFDVKRFDIYRKIPKDLTQPTLTGALVSILSGMFIVFLLLSEFHAFIMSDIMSELFVDNSGGGGGQISVFINISLPRLKCEVVGLDIQDEMGRHEVGFVEDTEKVPVNNGLGCRFEGRFWINKVPGNFHMSTHSAPVQPASPDMTHVVHDLRFGEDLAAFLPDHIKGSFNPLDEVERLHANALSSHDYFLKIVPTIFENRSDKKSFAFQYTYAYKDYISFGHGNRVMPAIWFRYDLSPITVKYTDKRKPFYHFITTICAVVGGTFTVAGIIDSVIFTAAEVFKKAELGKLS